MAPVVETSSQGNGRTVKYSDSDVTDEYQTPEAFDLKEVIADLTTGKGFHTLKNVFSKKDIEMAKERVLQRLKIDVDDYTSGDVKRDFGHNSFSGMDFELFPMGRIYSKMVCHPAILDIAKGVCGNRCRLSSFCSNTVPPGMGGQKPHLDYPSYREMWPQDQDRDQSRFKMAPHHQLSMVFVICLTDFTPDNGSTAVVPYSQLKGEFPDNQQEFEQTAVRLIAKAGDVGIISGRLQHCAMPNTSNNYRSGLIQQMCPLYVNPFQDMKSQARDWHTEEVKNMLVMEPPKW